VVWVPKIMKLFLFNCVCGFFADAVVLFFLDDVTLGLWLLSSGSLFRSMDVIVRKLVDLILRRQGKIKPLHQRRIHKHS